jgi:transcriptional regulator with XRE-family HTH domain
VEVGLEHIGEAIKKIREGKARSQAGTAAVAGINPSTLNQIETGRREPEIGTLEKVADALGITVSQLFAEYESLKEQAPLFSDEERPGRRWRKAAEDHAKRYTPLAESEELTLVASSKLARQTVSLLQDVNSILRAANKDDNYDLNDLNDLQIAFDRLQAFAASVLDNHKRRFGEPQEGLRKVVDNTRKTA